MNRRSIFLSWLAGFSAFFAKKLAAKSPPSEAILDSMRKSGSLIVDGWMFYDVNDDGVLEDVYLIADRKTSKLIYWDYAANHPRPALLHPSRLREGREASPIGWSEFTDANFMYSNDHGRVRVHNVEKIPT